jgi:lipid A ethanolaminephosphotransferase
MLNGFALRPNFMSSPAFRATAARWVARWHASRPRWRVETLALGASLFFALACNGPLWAALLAGREPAAPSTWAFAAGCFVALVALQGLLLLVLLNRYTAKPLLALLLAATAFAVYYMRKYGVFLDPTMLRNVLHTDMHEARELLGWGLLPQLLLYAGLPLLFLAWVQLKRERWTRALALRAAWLLVAFVAAAGAIWSVFQDLSSLMRNQKEVRYLVTPGNYLVSLASVLRSDTQAAARPRHAIGTDAVAGPHWAGGKARPALLVLVVGETARAASWGLNGYARQTTPELAALPDLINFPQVTSCGTNTETSVPCMFSPWGRRQYDEARIRGSESLLHVLQRAGVEVLWRDNQSGCKGVCDGLKQQVMSRTDDPALCDGERCLDEILLHGLDEWMAGLRTGQPQVLVLHQLGNHGPAYYKRYPPEFRRFVPTCDNPDLRTCNRQQIVNAYDNALLYTDHVLARLIALLRARQDSLDTALVYVSDHGESLGENNLFLHGLPYAIAPDVQTQVPMVMWFSEAYARDFRLDLDCLRRRAALPAQHDHLFHTVLGLMDVRTRVYERAMDLTADCRR